MRRALALVVLGIAACVATVPIEGAPCPCPEGFRCCETSQACLPEGTACPARPPPSSLTPCARDAECPPNEACHAWTDDQAQPQGPRTCRRVCPPSAACAEGETCALAPRDGQALKTLQVARLCLPSTPPSGCEQTGCDGCTLDELNRMFCDGDSLAGCFLALHPTCGLSCTRAVIQGCGKDKCIADAGVAHCAVPMGLDPCLQFSCAGCPPQGFTCSGTAIVACEAVAVGEVDCPAYCRRREVRQCAQACTADGGVHCAP